MRTVGRADLSNPLFQGSSVIALIVPLQWVRVTETKARCSLQLRAQQSPVSGMQKQFPSHRQPGCTQPEEDSLVGRPKCHPGMDAKQGELGWACGKALLRHGGRIVAQPRSSVRRTCLLFHLGIP